MRSLPFIIGEFFNRKNHPVDCHHCLRIGSSKEEDLDPVFCEMCFWCDCVKDGICDLQKLNREYHVDKLPFEIDDCQYEIDASLGTIVRNPNKCVKCRRCVDVCPTGALHMQENIDKMLFYAHAYDFNTIGMVSASVLPDLEKLYGMEPGTLDGHKIIAGLKKLGLDAIISEEQIIDENQTEAEEIIHNASGRLIMSNSPAVKRFIRTYYPALADKVVWYKSVQETFAQAAEDLAVRLGYDTNKLKTVVVSGNNEDGVEVVENKTVDFAMNSREIYRTFKRTGVDVNKIQSTDAIKTSMEKEHAFGAVTAPIQFNYEKEPEIVTVDGKTIAIAHNLGQARKLLDEAAADTSTFDIIRLMA